MIHRSTSRLALAVAIVLAAALAAAAGQSSPVFVTAKGTHYHTHNDCPSLKRSNTVQSVALDKIGARTLCSLCQRRDNNK